jgi:putative nucleotidyltransferase with HDIG domain
MESRESDRWRARPAFARLLRVTAFVIPIVTSIAFVYAATRFVAPPAHSFVRYLAWWAGLSATATLVLLPMGRLSRRLLPLAALLRLSLVFPDGAPSRFRTALASSTVKSLEERLAEAKRDRNVTPKVAAERLLALVGLLDAHDNLTRGHSDRVRAYAQMIGRELGLNHRDVELLNWSALLHDIGKLEVPGEILTKDGRPTESEWAILRRHPEFGAALVQPLSPWLGEWCKAVYDHHERWDGTGYPNGAAGKEISLGGRIVAVADVYDVITSTRTYKQASTAGQGRKELARCAGTQFDPEIVRAFLGISLRPHRFATGPLAWLGQATVLARIPIGSVAGSFSAAALAVSATASAGLFHAHTPAAHPRRPIAVATTPTAHWQSSSSIRALAQPRNTRRKQPDGPAGARPTVPAADQVAGSTVDTSSPPRVDPGTSMPTGATQRTEPAGGSTSNQPAQPGEPPTGPSTPTSPSAPAGPSTPTSPSAPAVPSTPSLPSAPSTPSVPTVPSVPAPTPPTVPSLPTLPVSVPTTPPPLAAPTLPSP